MKKIVLFLSLVCLVSVLYGQGKKVVLVEEFTNTGCGPCAALNPTLDSIMNVKFPDAMLMVYHVNWPDAQDPMYLQNPTEVDTRRAYYDVTGVPSVSIDGAYKNSNAWSSYIEERKAMEQLFEIGITYTLNESNLLTVSSNIKAIKAVNGDKMRFFAVVIEEDIEFDKPTSNGETKFPHVMRKMLPNAEGFALPSTIAAGQEFSTSDTWQISDNSFYDIKEMAIVGFIQDLTTKEVFQAFYFPKVNNKVDDATVVVAEGMPRRICIPEFDAKVKIRNNGTNNLTACKLNVDVNGSVKQVAWSGNLKMFESALISVENFTDFDLNIGGVNDVKFWLTDINGTQKSSEPLSYKFYSALAAERQMELLLFTDKKPEEISWKVFNSVGELIDEGGNYTEERKTYKHMLNFKVDDCYRVVFYDAGGDGICCSNGNGYIKFTQINADGTTKEMYKGYYSGSEYSFDFSMSKVVPVSVADVAESNLVLYPNPSNGIVNIDLGVEVEAFVYDNTGKMVRNLSSVKGQMNLTDLPNGIYAVRFVGDDINVVKKIVVKR